MRLLRTHSTRSWQRLAGVTAALPLLVAGLLASPAQAAPASESIIASGIYNSSGAGCQGSGTSTDCLSWGLRVPSTITPKKDLTVTIEADSAPGRWAWNCLASDRIAGTAAFYDSPSNKLSESSLKSSAKLHAPPLRIVRRQRRAGRRHHVHPGASEHHLQDRSPGALRRLIPRPELWNDDDDPRVRRVHLLLLADCHDLRRQHTSEDHSNCEEAR